MQQIFIVLLAILLLAGKLYESNHIQIALNQFDIQVSVLALECYITDGVTSLSCTNGATYCDVSIFF